MGSVRLSSFTIVSERLPDGNHVLMNGCSGAVDVIPPVLAGFFSHVMANTAHGQAFLDEDILPPETFSTLLERGHLTRMAHEQEKAIVAEIARALHEEQRARPYFMIVPNIDCNYRCTYCFERHIQKTLKLPLSSINYHKNNVVMRREAIPRIYGCIEAIQRQAARDVGGMIILYGGEPLDAEHRDLVFDIVHTGCEKGYWFTAVTNGHDLDVYLPIVGERMLSQIQVSIDGPKAVHDKRRIYRGKGSSFDKIVSNVHKVLGSGGAQMHIRVNVDATSIGLFEEVLTFFKAQGWTDHERVIIYTNTVYEQDAGGRVGAEIEVARLAQHLDRMVSPYRNVFTSAPAVHASRAIEPVFDTGGRYALKGTYCSANSGNYIFAPDGQIYACWESIGKACSKIGSYLTDHGLVLDSEAAKRWFSRSVVDVDGCVECEFALVCGGGCAQYAEYNNRSLYQPYCDDFQRAFRMALADEVARRLTGGRLLDCVPTLQGAVINPLSEMEDTR